eukprot:gnl/TRDRNA2_/TRDRNA2_163971_c0_seq1.p1 gnl/TRDRNA2_/TRDRNA2_163971_c0~~gnl/TRDRNA2_/TRDRNA2_163971_c0_seq1.p1  ORF type:complete len:1100 (+),score=204.51 gnl/TRDRNA2_/TRDRNA2_163971_c0_seq1:242-3301(+)
MVPLTAACRGDAEEVVVRLLEHHADANILEPVSGSRPLKIALVRWNSSLVQVLLRHGATVDSVDNGGISAALVWVDSFAAAYKARGRERQRGVGPGPRSAASARSGGTPATASVPESPATAADEAKWSSWASRRQLFAEILQALSGACCDLNFQPPGRAPPLHAAWKQLDGVARTEAVDMLLEAKADANVTDASGRTLLHAICLAFGVQKSPVLMKDLARSLLRAHADPLREAATGETALDMAASAGIGGHHVFKEMLEVLPEVSLQGARWGRALFAELLCGGEPVVAALVPRTGTAHTNDLGQGPLEFLISLLLFRLQPPGVAVTQADMTLLGDALVQLRCAEILCRHGAQIQTPVPVWSRSWATQRAASALERLERLGADGLPRLASLAAGDPGDVTLLGDALVQLRCAEILCRHGAQIQTPVPVWSRSWATQRAASALERLERLGADGLPRLASLAAGDPGDVPRPLGAALAAACALAGLEPEHTSQDEIPWSRFWSAARRLLGEDGSGLLPELSRVMSSPVVTVPVAAAHEVQRYCEDPSFLKPDVLTEAGPAADALDAWIRAAHELRVARRTQGASLQEVCSRLELCLASQPDLRRRWLRLVLRSVADPDAEDGEGGRVAHLALRCGDLGIRDVLLPVLRRGANPHLRDASGISVLELVRERAERVLSGLPEGVGDEEEDEAAMSCSPSAGSAEALASAVADVECCSLQRALEEEVSAQRKAVEAIEERLGDTASQVQELRQDIEADLVRAFPALEGASEALEALDIRDIHEIRLLARPSHFVALAVAAVCVLLGVEPRNRSGIAQAGEDDSEANDVWSYEACMRYWTAGRKLLADGQFFQRLHCFDKDNIAEAAVEKLRLLEDNPVFDPEAAQRYSATAAAMMLWARAMITYHDVAQVVMPKKDRFLESQKCLESQEKALSKERQRLAAIEEQLIVSHGGSSGSMDFVVAAADGTDCTVSARTDADTPTAPSDATISGVAVGQVSAIPIDDALTVRVSILRRALRLSASAAAS